MKLHLVLSQEEYIALLENKSYDVILNKCQAYIREKVFNYLKNFQHYQDLKDDFYHEVYIQLKTKTLPSPAFLEACRRGIAFRWYLSKAILNELNTLLTRERNRRDLSVAIEGFYSNNPDDSFEHHNSVHFSDKSYLQLADSQDILNKLRHKMRSFLNSFSIVFPHLSGKLILLLKIQSRSPINDWDLRTCFPDMEKEGSQEFYNTLGNAEVYSHKTDAELYQDVAPFFKKYRKEKGSPEAMQRWLNKHISGNGENKGLLEKLEIQEGENIMKIANKKILMDFLFVYFQQSPEHHFSFTSNQTNKTETTTPPVFKIWKKIGGN